MQSVLLLVSLCKQRAVEQSFRRRWRAQVEELTFRLCQVALVLGTLAFFLLSAAVTFVSAYNHPGRDGATALSAAVLGAGFIALLPSLWEAVSRLTEPSG